LCVSRGARHEDGQGVEGLDAVVAFGGFAVDKDASGFGGELYAVAGDAWQS